LVVKDNLISTELLGTDPSKIIEWVKVNAKEHTKASDIYLDRIDVFDSELDPQIICDYYNLKCVVRIYESNYYEGIDFLKKGINVAKANNLNILAAKMLINLSTSYGSVHKYKLALACLEEAREYDTDTFTGNIYFNSIIVYEGLEDFEKQLEAIEKTKEISLINNNVILYAQTLGAQISFYLGKNDINNVLKYCLEYEEFCTKEDIQKDRVENIHSIADTLIKLGKAKDAFPYIDLGIKKAKDDKEKKLLLKLYIAGFQAAVDLDDFILAENYFKMIFADYTDSENEDLYLKAYEIDIMRQKKIGNQNALLSAYIAYKDYADKNTILKPDPHDSIHIEFVGKELDEVRKKNAKILKLNEELQAVSHMLSNDLKLPMKNISRNISFLEGSVKENENSDIKEYLSYLKVGAEELHSKSEMARSFLTYNLTEEKIRLNIKGIIQDVIDNLNRDDYTFTFKGDSFMINSVHHLAYDIFYYAFSIIIELNRTKLKDIEIRFDKDFQLSISDTGNGIYNSLKSSRYSKGSSEKSEKIRFYIAFMHKLVKIHGGKFSFTGLENEDAQFIINIPSLREEEIVSTL